MTIEYGSRGDPARSMALLWGEAQGPKRGPKPGLDLGRIVAAAVALADAEGLENLSMRRVAARLGVGAMSLYTYVPGKAELLDLMLDAAHGEAALPDAATGDWRARLEASAREDWALFGRHPWALQISGARALLGPNELARYEAALAAVAGLGLGGREMVAVVDLVGGYVRGAAQGAREAALAARHTGLTDDEWWAARSPILERYFDPARFPTLVAVEAAGGFAPGDGDHDYLLQFALDDFAFGLQRVLDGVAALVAARQG